MPQDSIVPCDIAIIYILIYRITIKAILNLIAKIL